MLLVGGMLYLNSWSWEAVGFTLFLFVIARPLSVLIALAGTGTPWRIRAMTGWFGVRGIGSLYYLMYAIQHGLPEPLGLKLIQLTLIVITMSILLHGVSVKPLMEHVWQRGKRARRKNDGAELAAGGRTSRDSRACPQNRARPRKLLYL